MLASSSKIVVADDFSRYPAGRYENDGAYNGAKFRDSLLMPRLRAAIENDQKLVVSLDGVMSFGSSFLEEAFGGLVRCGLKKDEIRKHLEVSFAMAGGERYIAAIERYIDQARSNT